jgi:class III poly(R)-hydroxyalkanoic acid synthase PhaE subunit
MNNFPPHPFLYNGNPLNFSQKEQKMENIWQDLFPKFESGEDWHKFLDSYQQMLINQIDSTQELSNQFEAFFFGLPKNNLNTLELWQNYLNEMQKLNQLWVNTLGASVTESRNKPTGMNFSQPWIELNSRYWEVMYEKTLGDLTQIPGVGPSRGFNHKLMKALDAWEKLYPTSIDYQLVLAEIQQQSLEELRQTLISRAEKGETVKDWQQLQRLWSLSADNVFEKAFCLEDNLKVRGRFLNALNHYKLCQQELMELWMKTMNMPLRSEIDEVHKSIYELRKEVKRLNKTLAQYEAQSQSTPLAPEKAPIPPDLTREQILSVSEEAPILPDLSTEQVLFKPEEPPINQDSTEEQVGYDPDKDSFWGYLMKKAYFTFAQQTKKQEEEGKL